MKIIKYLPLLFLSISCSAQTNLEKYITDEDGIIVEKPDSGKNYDDINDCISDSNRSCCSSSKCEQQNPNGKITSLWSF